MRIPRKLVLAPGSAFHLWWRGHDREPVLASPREKSAYLARLKASMCHFARADARPDADPRNLRPADHPVRIFSFCLMSNHAHLAGALDPDAESLSPLSRLFQRAHSMFGAWYNRSRPGRRPRTGKVAEDRFKTRLVEDDDALRIVTLYGDANPVRAGMVRHPRDHRWCSYRFYAYGEAVEGVEILTVPGWYVALGRGAKARQRAYRRLVDRYLRNAGLLQDSPQTQADEEPAGLFVGSAAFVTRCKLGLREALAALRSKSPP